MARRVFITGIEGFTGKYLAAELYQAGYEIFGQSKTANINISNVKKLYQSNLKDFSHLADIIDEIKPDFVVNLAGISFVARGDAEEIYRTNFLGVRNLLEALLPHAKSLQAILLVSSAQVYGNTPGTLDESLPTMPANDYAVSKLAMEYLAKIYFDRLPITIVRPFNYTGVGQSENFLLPKIIKHIVSQAPVIELGNLDVARDFSDVRNVAYYYRLLLENPKVRGEIYNICSGNAYKLQDVLSTIESLSGRTLSVRINPAFVRANEIKELIGSSTKLKKAIGNIPIIPLIDTLKWMLESSL